MSLRETLLLPLLLGAGAVACVEPPPRDEPPPTDFELVTERVVIYGRGHDAEELCGGTVDWIDRYIDSFTPYLDFPDGVIARYFWYSDKLFAEDRPCGTGGACARLLSWSEGVPVVFSTWLPHEHELVHAVRMSVNPLCVPLLEEGLAEFLGALRTPRDTPGSIADLLEFSFSPKSTRKYTSSNYARARHFVSFLVDTYGLADVLELCRLVPDGSSQADFDVAAVELLGRDLDQLLVDYADYPVGDYPECPSNLNRAKIFECSREPVIQVGHDSEATFTIDASCSGPEAVGPQHGKYYISKQIRLLDDGVYAFSFEHPDMFFDFEVIPTMGLMVEQCAPCSESPTSVDFEATTGTLGSELNAGDYTVTFQIPLTEISDASTTELTVRVVGF